MKARELGISYATLYRLVQPDERTRSRRSDAGKPRGEWAEALDDISAFVVQHGYTPELALRTINTKRELEGLEPYRVDPSTLNRHLSAMGLSRTDDRDRRIHRSWEAPFAGYLWQMDSTVATSWYIDGDGRIGWESPEKLNKTKAGNGKPRLWLIVIVDDYSRTYWATYVTGNDQSCWVGALVRAMREGAFAEPARWPASGVPERLYTDQDSITKTLEFRSLLEGLGIELMKAMPSTAHFTNAQAKGKVERAVRTIQEGFEKVSLAKRFDCLQAINYALTEFLIEVNNKSRKHLGDQAAFERWIATARVRELPEADVVRALAVKQAEVKVKANLTIRVEKTDYRLPQRAPFMDLVGRTVVVRYNRVDLTWMTVVVAGEAHSIAAEVHVPDNPAEGIKSAPEPKAVQNRKKALQTDLTAYRDVVHRVHEHGNAKDPRVYPIRPAAQAPRLLELPVRMIRRGPAVDRLRTAGVVSLPPSPDEVAAMNALFAGRPDIPESELAAFINEHKKQSEQQQPQARPRLVLSA